MSDSAVSYKDGYLRIAGDLSIYTAATIRDELFALVPDGNDNIELDLSDVTALDTAGLQIVLVVRRMAQARGATFHVRKPSAAVLEVLELCGMQRLIDDATEAAA